MRVKGYSVSVGDLVAGIVSGLGVILAAFVGRSAGAAVLAATGSLWMATCAWIATILVGVLLFIGGASYVLRVSRSYRHPGKHAETHLNQPTSK